MELIAALATEMMSKKRGRVKGIGKKGQSANEAMILITFLTFFLIITLASVSDDLIRASDENYMALLQDLADFVEQEAQIAFGSENGYFHSFTLPRTLNGLPYTIGMINSTSIGDQANITILFVASANKNIPLNITRVLARDIRGSLVAGRVFIRKEGGTVIINSVPPLSVYGIVPNNGSIFGGTSVAIYGASFVATPTVRFGGAPATSVVLADSTQLTALTPAHAAGTVDITVTNPDGEFAILSSGYTYNPLPVLDDAVPRNGSTEGGTIVTIYGDNFIATPAVTFGGAPATSVVFVSSTQLTAFTPAHAAGTVDIIVTNPDGSSALLFSWFTYVLVPRITRWEYPLSNFNSNLVWLNVSNVSTGHTQNFHINGTYNQSCAAPCNVTLPPNVELQDLYINASTNVSTTAYSANVTIANVTIDVVPPRVDYAIGTIQNNALTPVNHAFVNVTVTDGTETSALIDFNRSLVGYWRFEERGTIAQDSSTYNKPGILTGFTCTTFDCDSTRRSERTSAGKRGKAVTLDGVDDYVQIGIDSSRKVTNFTVSMWVYDQAGTNEEGMIGTPDNNNFGFKVYTTGPFNQYNFLVGNGTSFNVVNGPQLNGFTNRWTHVAMVYKNSPPNNIISNYINGKLQASNTLNLQRGINWSTFTSLQIGRATSGSTYSFNGSIDEVQLWNRALSETEINASYQAGVYRLFRNFTGLAEGNYSITAIAVDKGGNINYTTSRNFTYKIPQCSDGIDNDADSFTDYPVDIGCANANDNDERNQCSDGIDNDADTLIDFPADAGCTSAADNNELNCVVGQDTLWGANQYDCTGADKRCYSGSCITCAGWMNAGYCWYEGIGAQSCSSVCLTRGGVYQGTCDWVNDPTDCSTCLHFHPGTFCNAGGDWLGPKYYSGAPECRYHDDGQNWCSFGNANEWRQCACNSNGAPNQCSDGIDNDADSFTDFPADIGCTDVNDNDELNVPSITTVTPPTGPYAGGTSVTINGSNFEPELTLKFGGNTASVSSVTSTQINATSPASSNIIAYYDWNDVVTCDKGTPFAGPACDGTTRSFSSPDYPWSCSGNINVPQAAAYNIWVKQYQGPEGSLGRAVNVNIAGLPYTAGTKGPNTAWVWEKVGTLSLPAGLVSASVSSHPSSVGAWAIGSILITTSSNPVNSCSLPVDVTVTNPGGSSATKSNGFSYTRGCPLIGLDTVWGANQYDCTGANKRCYSGSCITCAGWMNAGYCWYQGAGDESCNSVCSTRGGVYQGTCDWVNDPTDCSTCLHFYPTYACTGADLLGPYWYRDVVQGIQGCKYHQDGQNACSGSSSTVWRQCACNR